KTSVAEAEVRRKTAERIAFALPQPPDLRDHAVIRLWRVETAPAREILAADRDRRIARQHSVQLESQRAVLSESLAYRRERENTHLDADVIAGIPEAEASDGRPVARLTASRAACEASAHEAVAEVGAVRRLRRCVVPRGEARCRCRNFGRRDR